MNNAFIINGIRFLALLTFQLVILKELSVGWEGPVFVNFIVYPLFIILLPIRTPMAAAVAASFALGLMVDFGYDSLGVHAGASVLTAYFRPFVLSKVEPREGYNVNYSPTKKQLGDRWFLRYASIILVVHLLFYYSLDSFSPFFLGTILLKVLFSFPLSMIFVIIVMYIFNPKD